MNPSLIQSCKGSIWIEPMSHFCWILSLLLHFRKNDFHRKKIKFHKLYHHLATLPWDDCWFSDAHILFQCGIHQLFYWEFFKRDFAWKLQQVHSSLACFLGSHWNFPRCKCVLQIYLHQICGFFSGGRNKNSQVCGYFVFWAFHDSYFFLQFNIDGWYNRHIN